MVGQRRRRWASIGQTISGWVVFAGLSQQTYKSAIFSYLYNKIGVSHIIITAYSITANENKHDTSQVDPPNPNKIHANLN